MREDVICRMYIGLYVFFGMLACVPFAIVALMTLPGLWSSMFSTVSELVTKGTLPIFNAGRIAEWFAFSLVTFGIFLFVHYCLRLARRSGLLPGRQLWIWTMVHEIAALCWVGWTMELYDALPVVIFFTFGWLPYFAMAAWACRKSGHAGKGSGV